ncbi:MAG: hypothetical protein R3B57_06720 [Phycisphaerales bacterium]
MIGRSGVALMAFAACLGVAPLAQAQNALDQDLYQSATPTSGRVDTYAGGARPINSVNRSAYGQFTGLNPMGDGRLLDQNLSLTTRYNDTTRVDPLQEMRFRSAVVTGNAPGGLSFRGDAGYGAARAFRGDLGSDDLFAYRRDSLYSGLIGAGIRGTDALQYQMSMTTGSQLPPQLVGDLVVDRSFTTRAPALSAEQGRAADVGDSKPLARRPATTEVDDGSMHAMLRSTAAYTTSMSLQPVLLNRFGAQDQMPDIGVTASTLRGIRLSALPEGTESPTAQQRIDDSARGEQAVEGTGRIETGYDAVMRQFAEADEALQKEREDREVQATEKSWMDRIAELQKQVSEGNKPSTEQQGGEATPGEEPSGGESEQTEPDDLDKLQELGVYDEETVELLRSVREPVKNLVDPSSAQKRDPYAEHMEVGQRLLTQERFFDAEERFTRAIGVRSGDVMAQVGRIHAQIGAGMYVSAALNMRVLLLQHPEIVGVRYDEKLLPGKNRQKAIFQRLREKAGIDEKGQVGTTSDPQLQRECGLLLAYFGYQFHDPAAIDQGLDAFESVTDEHADDKVFDVDRRLLELVRRVWAPESAP